MTVTANAPAGAAVPALETVTCTVDGVELTLPKGTLIIRAAELIGVEVPRFCDHPLLDPVAACRACLVEIEGQGKPQPACAIPVGEGMVVRTQVTSEVAATAQRGVMEFLLINHPLDCPICDKGGECPLQNQAMAVGRGVSRFDGVKRTFPKPINISAQILLDRERCVSCARCTRFADQIAGDPLIELLERGAQQQVGISDDQPFDSYFSGNTVQICPVGALTSARYRFRSRPFDLVSVPTVCEHCASGCELRTDLRRGTVMRRQAADDPAVNEEWNCDKGRFAFTYLHDGRLEQPLVRGADGMLAPASWPEAVAAAAAGLAAARGRAAVLTGGRVTQEDAYAYARFARVALGTDDLDFRARPHSAEEAAFLAAVVAGRGLGPTYADLEAAPVVLLVGLEPEDESPIVFLRLRKAFRHRALPVFAVQSWAGPGLEKMGGSLLAAAPGTEPEVLDALADGAAGLDSAGSRAAAALTEPGAVVLVGERMATSPGALSAAARLAAATGARLGWVPRRAGERGAVEAGAVAGLLPGGRPLTDPRARDEVAAAWGIEPADLPGTPGQDADGIVRTALEGGYGAIVVGGVDPLDTAAPTALYAALGAVPFVVSLETRVTAVTDHADVVLPVAVVTEKAGTFIDWEGRPRPFTAAVKDSYSLPDARVLSMIGDELDLRLGRGDVESLRREITALGVWEGERPAAPSVPAAPPPAPAAGEAVLSTWRHLLDLGRLQEGEPFLAATARRAVARLSAATAAEVGVVDGGFLVVTTDAGSLEMLASIETMPDRTVWLPTNSQWSQVRQTLGVDTGAVVRLSRGGE